MTHFSDNSAKGAIGVGSAAIIASLIINTVGGAFAKQLFPVVGTHGVTALRIGLSASMLLVVLRPWRRIPNRSEWPSLVGFGLVLGLMNVLIYQSFARIPIGIAVAIEVLGPLAIVLLGSRKLSDYAWLVMAVVGLVMLLPIAGSAALDPVGIAFAVGAAVCWALYIVLGKRVSTTVGRDAAAWGSLAAAVIFVPFGAANSDLTRLSLTLWAAAFGVAALSSAIPYLLEMEAMRRLPQHVFGIFSSTCPAVAAIVGLVMLGEQLNLQQWTAMLLIVGASIGCAYGSSSSAQVKASSKKRFPSRTGDHPVPTLS